MFNSITRWQAEDWIVSVRVDGFASVHDAAELGNSVGKRPCLIGEQLVLIDDDGTLHSIDEAHAVATRLLPQIAIELTTICQQN